MCDSPALKNIGIISERMSIPFTHGGQITFITIKGNRKLIWGCHNSSQIFNSIFTIVL